MNLRDEYVLALEAENETLREKLIALQETLGCRIETPLILGLSGQEAKMFGILLKRELVTKEQAMDVLYGDRPDADEAEIKIVDVFVCKIRKKLKPYDIAIETVWGQMAREYRRQKSAFHGKQTVSARQTFIVTVEKFGEAKYSASSHQQARSLAWKAFRNVSEGLSYAEFMRISSVRKAAERAA